MARINESFYSTTPVVDEQTKRQAMRTAQPTQPTPAVDTRIALRKLQSGETLTDDEKRSLGLPVAEATVTPAPVTPTPVTPTPVTPTPVTPTPIIPEPVEPTGVPAGFTAGPFPKELEQFFGSSAGILGYRITTNPNGSQQLEVSDAPGSSKTFGFQFTIDDTGKYVPFKSSGGSGLGGSGLGTGTATSLSTADIAGRAERQSAYDLLFQQFNQYGLGALVEPLKGLITSGASPAEFTIKLRETDAYKKRFAANQARIQKGLTAISEAEYLGLEDQYQNIMRNYGLPESYYARGEMGTQEGFNKFIANDVSAAELEDRVMTAQNRVMNANPEVLASLKAFYPDISNSDILAYTLDPTKGLDAIKRKVTAAEIGGAATQAGLKTGVTRAEELTAAGITKQQAQQGFQTVAEVAPRGGQLAEIYKQNPYTQTTAEAEVFGLSGSAEAARQRKKLTSLETAAFSGSAGAGAIARDRAGVL